MRCDPLVEQAALCHADLHGQRLPDGAVGDQVACPSKGTHVPALVAAEQLDPRRVAGSQHGVGFAHRVGQRLLRNDRLHRIARGQQRHHRMQRSRRGDAHNVQ